MVGLRKLRLVHPVRHPEYHALEAILPLVLDFVWKHQVARRSCCSQPSCSEGFTRCWWLELSYQDYTASAFPIQGTKSVRWLQSSHWSNSSEDLFGKSKWNYDCVLDGMEHEPKSKPQRYGSIHTLRDEGRSSCLVSIGPKRNLQPSRCSKGAASTLVLQSRYKIAIAITTSTAAVVHSTTITLRRGSWWL